MKKLFYLLLLIALFVSLFAFTASAGTYGDLTYTMSNGKVTITDCNQSAVSVTIPSKINGYPVTSIGDDAFTFCYSLTSVILPESITSIGDDAFYNCESLTSINIPDGVISIGSQAFLNCSSLTTITIPASVTSISYRAFRNCLSLTSITIPPSVISIGDEAFYNCPALENVNISDFTAWCNINFEGYYSNPLCNGGRLLLNGEEFSGNIILSEGITKIPSYTFQNCKDILSITIPDSVTSIGDYAFDDCTNLIIVEFEKDSTLTSIGSRAFYGCTSLTSITIPDSVTSIDTGAFESCTSLTSINIPSSVTSIGGDAFNYCSSLKQVRISDLLAWCNIRFQNEYSNPLYFAGKFYLNGEIVTDLVIPSSVTSIGSYAFVCSSLISITIPASVTSISSFAFAGCHYLTKVEFEKDSTLTSIGSSAFQMCLSLTSITVPSSVTSISSFAFRWSGLTSITIPSSVMNIGKEAFFYSNTKEVHITDLTAWCNIDFDSDTSNPCYYADKFYINGEQITSLTIPEEVKVIKPYVFYGFDFVESIEIPETMTAITANAFGGCTNLKKVIIPSTTTLISGSAFSSPVEIHGLLGSEAENFAKLKGYTFVPLDDVVYEITYNLSGGNGNFEAGKKGVYADYCITNKVPTKRHCTFLGWATEENGDVVYESGDIYSANSDLTLFAVWQEPQVVIDDITVTPGGSFYVDLVVENSVPIKAMTINNIEYSDVLTLTNAEWLFTDSTLSSVDINGDSLIAFQNAVDANKAVMRLYFTVDSELEDQEAYISFNAKGTDEENEIFDFVSCDGTVSIRNFIVGDCDGDEEITIDDAIYLAFYTFYSDRYQIPNGMNVDFNNDGEVTIDDAIYLAFYTFYPDRYPINK